MEEKVNGFSDQIHAGIDPGLKGAIAFLGGTADTAMPMPVTGTGKGGAIDGRELARQLMLWRPAMVTVEKVHSMPRQGVASSFKFGRGFGVVLGVLQALRVPYQLVTPQAWKKAVLAGLDWKGNKQASVQFAMARWPDVSLLPTPRSRVPNDGMADALCLADYGRLHG